MADELADAMERYTRLMPAGDPRRPAGSGPVSTFPRLTNLARTMHPSQWAGMMRAVARLTEFHADPAETLGYEASMYLIQQGRRRR